MEIKLTMNHSLRKWILMMIMRTFIFLLCTAVFSFNTESGLAQEKVKIDQDKVITVDEVFDLIIDQTKYNFLYPADLFKNVPKIQLKKGVTSVGKLLQQALPKGQFNVIFGAENRITIKERKRNQQQQVSGKVTDDGGEPLPGVSVLIKGTNKGAISDFEGKFSLTVPYPENVLVFSSLGYVTKEVTVGNQTTINVKLKEAENQLDEVVINAGYYKTTRKLATGSIGTVKAKAIGQQPITNPIDGLIGKIAGLQITQGSGMPGAAATVRIRGINSLNGTDANLPLYIINGIPVPATTVDAGSRNNPLEYLNTADIESIDVLKDADATAIYGSRGSNGVILITTKKGKAGKTKIDVEYSYGLLKAPNLNGIKLLNTTDYLAMRRQALEAEGNWPITSRPITNADVASWDPNRNINWRKVLLGGLGEQTRGRFSASGGAKNTNFLFSLNLSKQTNIFNFDDSAHKTASALLNINHKSEKNGFHASFTSRYSITQNNQNTEATSNIFLKAFTLAPNAPELLDANGNINFENETFADNPLAALEKSNERETRNFNGSVTLGYDDIIPNVNAKVVFGASNTQSNIVKLIPNSSLSPRRLSRSYSLGENNTTVGSSNTWNIEPEVSYQKSIGEHNFIVQVGASFQSATKERIVIRAYGYTSDLLLRDLSLAPTKLIRNNNVSQYKYNAFYARLNYNYKDKYLLNLTGRRDGSSRFGNGKKFGNFGAVGAAWVFSEEEVVKNNLSFLSFGKIRGSYGITGSDQIGDYQYLSTYRNLGGDTYTGVAGLIPSRAENPNYSWETNNKLEIALDLSLFNNRINMETAWYQNRSSNQLIGLPLSTVTGFSRQQFNLPALVENRGLEFTVNTVNMSNDNFRWTSSFNISKEINELKEFANIENFSAFDNRYKVGESLYGSKQYESSGVDPTTGLYAITDVNGDGGINVFDKQFFIDTAPDFYGGFGNSFTYKNWQLDVFLSFKKQQGYDYILDIGRPGQAKTNFPVELLDNYWVNPGDNARFQELNTRSTAHYYSTQYHYNSARNFTDRSYLKLQNVSLTYNFPNKILESIGFSAAKFYVRGQNLGTITSFKGLDPESTGLSLPQLRTVITGVQLTF